MIVILIAPNKDKLNASQNKKFQANEIVIIDSSEKIAILEED